MPAIIVLAGACLGLLAMLMPLVVAHAAGSAADAMCAGCQITDPSKPRYCMTTPCSDVTSGFTTGGMCAAPGKCAASSTNGGGLGDISKLLQGIASLIQALNQPSQQSGNTGTTPCASLPTTDASGNPISTTTPTTLDANGCPVLSSSTGASSLVTSTTPDSTAGSDLSSLLNNTSSSDLSSALGTMSNTTSPLPPDTSNITVATTTPSGVQYVNNAVFGGQDGISGDVQVVGTGITAFVSDRDSGKNTQTSAFYGEDASGTVTPSLFVYRLCVARPWADNFLSFIVPATFFDSVCRAHGFVAPKVVTAPRPARKVVTIPASTTPPYVAPAASIYAVPDSVRSGFRTSVFWNATGVDSCAESSDDGTFTASTVSGHQASEPLSVDTTFTITCTAASTTVTDHTTVPIVQSQ